MNDVIDIIQLIMRERQGRDRGWWTQAAETFHPDATLRLSWIDGTATEFVERSRAMMARSSGPSGMHRISCPVVHVNGDRAVVEIEVTINSRAPFDGVEADLMTALRGIYLTERRDGQWRISRMDAIYEFDTLTAAVPGESVTIDPSALEGFRPSYRLLAYYFQRMGITVPDDLYGVDRPAEVAELYRSAFAWAGIDHPDVKQ